MLPYQCIAYRFSEVNYIQQQCDKLVFFARFLRYLDIFNRSVLLQTTWAETAWDIQSGIQKSSAHHSALGMFININNNKNIVIGLY